jgi:hypothetical protein
MEKMLFMSFLSNLVVGVCIFHKLRVATARTNPGTSTSLDIANEITVKLALLLTQYFESSIVLRILKLEAKLVV